MACYGDSFTYIHYTAHKFITILLGITLIRPLSHVIIIKRYFHMMLRHTPLVVWILQLMQSYECNLRLKNFARASMIATDGTVPGWTLLGGR
jgi:hypothetical protein